MSNIFSISSDLTFIFTIISYAAERRLDEGPLVESSSPYHVSGRASETLHDSIYREPLYLKPLEGTTRLPKSNKHISSVWDSHYFFYHSTYRCIQLQLSQLPFFTIQHPKNPSHI